MRIDLSVRAQDEPIAIANQFEEFTPTMDHSTISRVPSVNQPAPRMSVNRQQERSGCVKTGAVIKAVKHRISASEMQARRSSSTQSDVSNPSDSLDCTANPHELWRRQAEMLCRVRQNKRNPSRPRQLKRLSAGLQSESQPLPVQTPPRMEA